MPYFSHQQLKDHDQEAHILQRRTFFVIAFCLLLTLILVTRLLFLEIFSYKKYKLLSQRNRLTQASIPSKRGLIYDRHGIILAQNRPTFSLNIIPKSTKNFTQTLHSLQHYITLNPYHIKTLLDQKKHQLLPYDAISVKINLSDQELARFMVNKYRFPEIDVYAHFMRYYPQHNSLAHLVGYVGYGTGKNSNHSYIGQSGLEKTLDSLLRGKSGIKHIEKDAHGHITQMIPITTPAPGHDVYLTLDSRLQAFSHRIMAQDDGAIVALNPATGEILALVSHPSYDPNHFVQGMDANTFNQLRHNPRHPLFERSVLGRFAPGSSIKVFEALLALDQHIITTETEFYDEGMLHFPHTQHIYHDWKPGGHGWVNVTRAIVVSCDVFFYHLGIQLGINRITPWLHNFGFGEPIDLPLPQQASGILPSPDWKIKHIGKKWYRGDTINTSIGQGYTLVTPLQLAYATSILANRGRRIMPQLILKISNPSQHTVSSYHTIEKSPLILKHPHVWHTVIDAMKDVIQQPEGTGHRFGDPEGYSVAGKTGTAQIIRRMEKKALKPKKWRNNSLFIAFAPIEHPQIVLAVVIEHSPKAIHIARKFLDYYFSLYPIEKHETY